jgi:hypothetical protein
VAIPYHEGQFFLLPVARGAHAVGLIARAPPRGGVLLGYFFGPRRTYAPDVEWLNARLPRQASLVCRFRDAALYSGEWKLLGMLPGFERRIWPVPAFHRFDGSITGVPGSDVVQNWRVEYGDDNLIVPLTEVAARDDDLTLGDDLVYDANLLAHDVGLRVTEMVPTIDEASRL